MRRLTKHASMLKTLAKAKPHMRKAIIKSAGTSLITCLCDCVNNTLKGKVKMSKHQYRKIRRHKHDLRALNNSRTTAEKKQIIQQSQLLEFCINDKSLSDLGGLDNFKSWLKR